MTTFAIPGVSPEQLGQLFQEFMASRVGPQVTFRDLWVKYEAFGTMVVATNGRKRIKSWDMNQKSHAQHLLAFFGDLTWDQVTLAKAEEYRVWRAGVPNRRTGDPCKPSTRNRELRSAQGCLSHARRLGLIPRNPMAGLKDEPDHHDRDFTITKQQFQAILAHSPPYLRALLIVMYETGMRRNELLTLEWSEVDLDNGMLKLTGAKTKGGYDRDVPLSTAALATLEMVPAFGGNPYVFANQYKPGTHAKPSKTNKDFRKAREAAGVVGPKGQDIWMHTFRHTFATDMVTEYGLDIPTLMSICGWKDEKVMQRYLNIANRHRLAAKRKINERSADLLTTDKPEVTIQDEPLPPKRAELRVVHAAVAPKIAKK